LRRTRVGPYAAENGISLDVSPEVARSSLVPMTTAIAGLPQAVLNTDEERRFRTGQSISMPGNEQLPVAFGSIAILNPTGDLVGLAEGYAGGVKPQIVFNM